MVTALPGRSTGIPTKHRCVIYCRISKDDLGLGKGVERQLEDSRALAAQHGWSIVLEYSDNDISAFNGAVRPGYNEMMAAAERGEFDRIVVYMTSRLWRSRTERAAAINKLGRLRIDIQAVRGPELNLSSAAGRVIADVLGSFDTLEAETMSERLQRAALQRATEGRPHAFVLYGWRREYEYDSSGRIIGSHDVENPDEADIVREVVGRILQGEPLRSVVRDLNARQVKSPRGSEWKPTLVRQLAMRPANASIRLYKGKVVGDAVWPAIVSRDKHEQVIAFLTAPSRQSKRDGRRRHLLSFGIGICGVCGSPLSARLEHKRKNGTPRWVYRCNTPHGCVSRRLDLIDELVGAVVIARLSRPDAAEVFAGDSDGGRVAQEKADAIRAKLDTAADAFANGDIDGAQLKRISERLRPEREAAEAALRSSRPAAVPVEAEELQGDKAALVWKQLPVTGKRAVLEALGLKVKILPPAKRNGRFDPRDIEFRW